MSKSKKQKVEKTAAKATPPVEKTAHTAAGKADPKARKKTARKDGTMSGLDAAAKILGDAKEPLNCRTIVERAVQKGLWKSDGKTPHATVYSAILREIAKKGDAARFRKAARGKFESAK
jgi:hypothetical protein